MSKESTPLLVEGRQGELSPPPSRWQKEIFLEPKTIRPSTKTLKMRIEAEKRKPEIAEPIILRLRTTELRPLMAQLSSDATFRKFNSSEKAAFELMKNLESRIEKKQHTPQNPQTSPNLAGHLTLTAGDLEWIDLEKLSQTLAFPSLEPFLPISELTSLAENDSATLERWRAHFGSRYPEIRRKIDKWLAIHANAIQMPLAALLPDHMRQLLGRYSPFRGRNCFATALQFADPNVIQAKNINMVQESGHSQALINHDEFSHALWLGYDELTPHQVGAGLMYGDLIAVVDGDNTMAYTSLKHAAIHIAGDVFLHKPSKSASSPIEFVRWRELVRTWSPLVKQLDIRYFRRRPGPKIQEQSPEFAIEKIRWNR